MKPLTTYQASVLDGMARAESQGVSYPWHSVAWPTRRALLNLDYVSRFDFRLTAAGQAFVLGCRMGQRERKVLA